MKNLQNLKGAKALNKNEQRNITGGTNPGCGYREHWCPNIGICISVDLDCPFGGGPGDPPKK